jgi:hypothetical protein
MPFGRRGSRNDPAAAPGRLEPPAPAPGPDAAELVLDEARRTETSLMASHGNLDQKAGVLLAFAGVLVTLLAGTVNSLPTWSRAASAGIAAIAGVVAAILIGTKPSGLLSPSGLVNEGVPDLPRADAVRLVTNVLAFLTVDATEKLDRKTLWLRVTAILLGISVVVVVVGLIVGVDVGPPASTPVVGSIPTPGGPRP